MVNWRNGVTFCVALGIIWVGFTFCYPWPQPEPTYHGKKLSTWLLDCGSVIDGIWVPTWNGKQHDQAVLAIRGIGSDACPYLVVLLNTRHSQLTLHLEWWINEFAGRVGHKSGIRFYRYSDYECQGMALKGLESLGPKAKACIPALEAYIKREDIRDGSWTTKYARIILFKLAPDSDLHQSSDAEISMLTEILLGDKDVSSRQLAVKTLGHLGKMAKRSEPAIRAAFNDEAIQVRLAATNALRRIDLSVRIAQ